mgnify:CR=1 FL=1
MDRRRAVITGMGVVSPVGSTLETFWESLLEGRSGVGPLTKLDPDLFSTKFNVIPPGVSFDLYYPYSETERRASRQTERLEERLFTVEEALAADEAFLSSATTLVMPIVEIDGKQIGDESD